MELPEEVFQKLLEEAKLELKSIPSRKNGGKPTFDDLEGGILSIRQKFGERLMQAVLEYEFSQESSEKKTAVFVDTDFTKKD